MWQLCVLVTTLVHSGGVVGQGLVFPGSSDSFSLSCTITRTGQKGECKLSTHCPSHQRAAGEGAVSQVCGVSSELPLVCCPIPPERLIDGTRWDLQRKTVPAPPNEPVCGVLRPFRRRESFLIAGGKAPQDNSLGTRVRRSPREFSDDGDNKLVKNLEVLQRHSTPLPLNPLSLQPLDQPSVVGGIDAPVHRHPWMHNSLRPDVVRLAEHDYSNTHESIAHEDHRVADVVVHPDYQADGTFSSYHDLALIKVVDRIRIRVGVTPICLPWGDEARRILHHKNVTITGWGAKAYGGNGSPILQEGSVTVFPSEVCNASFSKLPFYSTNWPRGIAEDTFLCAGRPLGGVDTCKGDSGGPLVYFASDHMKGGVSVLGGVVSQGYGCGLEDYPGLYVPLSNPDYLRWIKTVAFGKN
ncbi:clotting factor B [Hyalella azteca]|uniref:Clotting factor B n=1 Tax=Hyalella azteca TaxID=294128 RepID=A0A8B7N988_HYAAZ|nr:clotting factor B [Hyalella azteca]